VVVAARTRPGRRASNGSNYLLAWFAFGDMTSAEQLASFGLFAREVMPAFAETHAAAE
jgi:hypothetical protein